VPGASNVDGLPAAVFATTLHFTLAAACAALPWASGWLQLENVIDGQATCAYRDLVLDACGGPPKALALAVWIVVLVALCFMCVRRRRAAAVPPPRRPPHSTPKRALFWVTRPPAGPAANTPAGPGRGVARRPWEWDVLLFRRSGARSGGGRGWGACLGRRLMRTFARS
jgi:hypothetical protein